MSLEIAPIIFALIKTHASYWVMSFWVMILIGKLTIYFITIA